MISTILETVGAIVAVLTVAGLALLAYEWFRLRNRPIEDWEIEHDIADQVDTWLRSR